MRHTLQLLVNKLHSERMQVPAEIFVAPLCRYSILLFFASVAFFTTGCDSRQNASDTIDRGMEKVERNAPAVEKGTLKIETIPAQIAVTVYIDRLKRAINTPYIEELSVGKHLVQLRPAANYKPATFYVTVHAGKTESIIHRLQFTESYLQKRKRSEQHRERMLQNKGQE